MRSTVLATLLSAILLFLAACGKDSPSTAQAGGIDRVAPVFDAGFWNHWGDGKAEVTGYDLTIPRYGELRKGTAVAIFVTETFSNDRRVKADPGKHPASDEFPVMKLNLVEDFPTGVYDYNLMTSSFLALESVNGRPAGSPTKVSFSSQEWCGHVYSQALFDAHSIQHTAHSYFDGEADMQQTVEHPGNGISEDALWFWARGMAGPRLEPGGSAEALLLMSLQRSRMSHQALDWRLATLSRAAETEEITVPAGAFTVQRWMVRTEEAGGQAAASRTFYVEVDEPHRIIKWETSNGELAEMLNSERLQYWKMNSSEYASAVEKIGLSPRPARTP